MTGMMGFIRTGAITSCALALGFGLGQIVAYSEYGDGQAILRLGPDIFYSALFGVLSLSLGVLSLFMIWAAGDRCKRARVIEGGIWICMTAILALTIMSIHSLLFGWAGVT